LSFGYIEGIRDAQYRSTARMRRILVNTAWIA